MACMIFTGTPPNAGALRPMRKSSTVSYFVLYLYCSLVTCLYCGVELNNQVLVHGAHVAQHHPNQTA